VAIEFLTAKEVSPEEIHRRLSSVSGEHTVNVSTVRCWVRHFKSGETEIDDKPPSSRSATAVTVDNRSRVG
jgi:transposase-like protein